MALDRLTTALLVGIVSTFGISSSTPIPANFTVFNYTQKVDHFSYTNNDTFQQRVIISTDHWCKDACPIFFYAGNEGDIFMFANNTGFMWENAPKFGAMVIFAEHRYYGESLPYGAKALEGEDLKAWGYLSAEQALADYAQLLESIKVMYPGAKKSPTIVFGGSYGGMLAAWFRMKYPHLAEGALAASAPILQFPGLYNCSYFNRIITKDFTNYSPACSETIRKSWAAIRRLGKEPSGLLWLTQTFKLCRPLKTEDVDTLVNWLSETYQNLAMIDYPNPATFLSPLPAYPIKEVCKHMRNASQPDKCILQDLANGMAVYYNYTGKAKCNDIWNDNSGLGDKPWGLQSCTEMVMPVCADGVHDMFEYSPWNITQYNEECVKSWKVVPESNKIEMMFSGTKLSSYSNIIFSNGDRDPWSAGGVLETISESLVSIIIPHACHHEDLRPSGPNDPRSLVTARHKEIKIIRKWINSYYDRIGYYPLQYNPNFIPTSFD